MREVARFAEVPACAAEVPAHVAEVTGDAAVATSTAVATPVEPPRKRKRGFSTLR
jgi:hypothetical protein